MSNKEAKRAAKVAREQERQGQPVLSLEGHKLRRIQYCIKPGIDGCVNTEGSVWEDCGWWHWCPACKTMHAINVEHPNGNKARWMFDGDLNKPTFHPSIKIKIGPMPTVPEGRPDAGKTFVCHYHLRHGKITYCDDCTHELKGQTIDLPPIPEGEL